MNHRSRVPAFSLRQRAAWVLLLVFLMGHTPALPAAGGLLAWIDGGHEVQFTSTRDGVLMKLHHPSKAGASSHAHSGLICVVTAFTRTTGPGHPDHLVALPTGGSDDLTGDMKSAAVHELPTIELLHKLPAPFPRHGSDASAALRLVKDGVPPPDIDITGSVQLLI